MDNVFVSPYEEWPGSITLPHPFLGSHYKQWTAAVSASRKKSPSADLLHIWAGVCAIGEVDIAGVEPDETGDTVPYEIFSWAAGNAAQWMAGKLSPKKLLSPSGNSTGAAVHLRSS